MIDVGGIVGCKTGVHVRSIVVFLPQMAELLCVCDRRGFFAVDGRAGLLVRSIVIHGFIVADGRVALLTRSIEASLPRMAEVSLRYIHGRCINVALAGATPCPDILSA